MKNIIFIGIHDNLDYYDEVVDISYFDEENETFPSDSVPIDGVDIEKLVKENPIKLIKFSSRWYFAADYISNISILDKQRNILEVNFSFSSLRKKKRNSINGFSISAKCEMDLNALVDSLNPKIKEKIRANLLKDML